MFNKDDMQKIGNRKHLLAAIHVIGWGIFFAFPLFFTRNDHQFIVTLRWYLGYFLLPLSCMIVFYTNYFYFIDNILFPKKIFRFIVINLLVIILLGLLLHFWQEFYRRCVHCHKKAEYCCADCANSRIGGWNTQTITKEVFLGLQDCHNNRCHHWRKYDICVSTRKSFCLYGCADRNRHPDSRWVL